MEATDSVEQTLGDSDERKALPSKKRKKMESAPIPSAQRQRAGSTDTAGGDRPRNKKKNRKRKSMDSGPLPIAEEADHPTIKRRKIDQSSSVSTTVSMSPSPGAVPPGSASTVREGIVRDAPIPSKAATKRKSRKRGFKEVFLCNIDEDAEEGGHRGNGGRDRKEDGPRDGGGDDDDDEDDDLKHEGKDSVPSMVKAVRPKKRVRLDTPMSTQLFFDPIDLHCAHCPFRRMHGHRAESAPGYEHALRMLPMDVMYIKQMVEQHTKKETP